MCLLCFFALWLRLPRISQGLPFFYDEDEAHHFNRVVNMVKRGELNPHYFLKPSLHFYLRMPVVAASFLWSVRKGHISSIQEIRTHDPFGVGDYAFSVSHPGIVKGNRAFSVILSVLLVLFTFLTAREVCSSLWTAFLAASLAAASPALAAKAGIIGVDGLMALMCLVSVYCSIKLYKNYSLPLLAFTGIICGLAVSSKYNALPAAGLPLAVCLMRGRLSLPPLIVCLAAPLAGFLAGTPFLVTSLPLFLDQVAAEIRHYAIEGHVGEMAEPGLEQAVFYLKWLSRSALGPIAAALGIVGIPLLFTRNRALNFLLLLFPLLYFTLMSMQKAHFTRNMLVIIPFVAIFAALIVHTMIAILQLKGKAASVAFGGFIVACLTHPLQTALVERKEALALTDSRTAAERWLTGHSLGANSETAISGQLQFPPSVYSVPGRTRVDESLLSITDLYLDGFDRFVATGAYAIPQNEEQLLAEVERGFDGVEERQRIVKNPAVTVYRLGRAQPNMRFLAEYVRGGKRNETTFTVERESEDSTTIRSRFKSCQDSQGQGNSAEDYCWLRSRVSFVKLKDLGQNTLSAAGPKASKLILTMQSPWPDQEAGIIVGDSRTKLTFTQPGQWQDFTIDIPYDVLSRDSALLVTLTQVHSPRALKLSPDSRRLGAALRSVTLK